MYSYEAQNDDELTIKEGDTIAILTKEVEDRGWWKGELNGRVGVFPDNFVQLIRTSSDDGHCSPQPAATAQNRPERPDKPAKALKPELPKALMGFNQPLPPLPVESNASGSGTPAAAAKGKKELTLIRSLLWITLFIQSRRHLLVITHVSVIRNNHGEIYSHLRMVACNYHIHM